MGQWFSGLVGLVFILTSVKKWWEIVSQSFTVPYTRNSFRSMVLWDFLREKHFSLRHLHELSTKSASLEMRPVQLSRPWWSLGTKNTASLSPILQKPV